MTVYCRTRNEANPSRAECDAGRSRIGIIPGLGQPAQLIWMSSGLSILTPPKPSINNLRAVA
jgi:hypothetical protein